MKTLTELLNWLLVRCLMSIKSLVVRVEVDKAAKAHNCRANSKHRIERGDIRLKVRDGRSWVHYCRLCADKIISRDIEKLKEIQLMAPSEV